MVRVVGVASRVVGMPGEGEMRGGCVDPVWIGFSTTFASRKICV